MRRWTKAIVPTLFILCATAFALQMVRSCYVSEKFVWHRGMTLFTVGTDYGRLNLYVEQMIWSEKAAYFWRLPHDPHRPWLAPEWRYSNPWSLEVPLWLLLLVTATASVTSKWRVARKHRSSCCRSCGYDLRATPQRCPECGMLAHVHDEARDNPPMQRSATADAGSIE